MATEIDVKFSEFTPATELKDADKIPILQDGQNKIIQTPILESKIINKTVSRVIAQGGASLNVINLKSVVPTYADLALITPTPELNDAYQVEADGLVYVYTENGFQADGDGFVVQPEPIGVVEEGNNNAVSGNEVNFNLKDRELITGYYNVLKNNSFADGINYWLKNEAIIDYSVVDNVLKIDTTGSNDPAVLQGVDFDKGEYYLEISIKLINNVFGNLRLGGTNNPLNIALNNNEKQVFSFYLNVTDTESYFMIAPFKNQIIEVDYIIFSKKTANGAFAKRADVENLNKLLYYPTKSYSKSNLLDAFKEIYSRRNKDINVVLTGDSIATNLKWSNERLDAKFRPPFCTEFNFTSMIEDKLRFHDMKYKRYDVEGVFTNILGGGNTFVTDVDNNNWGYVGTAYYLPLTQVLDNGTNAGVSFVLKSGIARLNLIVHTDKAWAENTRVDITQGNGKVQVYNGSNWVEANGYVMTLKEPDTLATLGFYKDNAQKRIQFRAVNPYEDINISVTNVGSGRFAYWGIEESRNYNTFSFIAASKGSHSNEMIEKYDSWMIEEFKPDLIIYQCPVLNHGFGFGRATGSANFGQQFYNRANQLKTNNNCEVLSFVLWGSTTSNLYDSNGNYTDLYAQNGQFVSCQMDVENIVYNFEVNNMPIVNLFDLINEVAEKKSLIEKSNKRISALNGSSKNGNTFTIDGIHLNTQGNEVVYNMMYHYFNL